MRRFRQPDTLALLGLAAAVVLALAVFVRARRPLEPVPVVAPAASFIKVHVVGEVVWPGLYGLKAGARVQDAIMAAHGPVLTADLKRVNLAAPLRDGDRVVIPRIVQPALPAAPETAPEDRRATRTSGPPARARPAGPPAAGEAAGTVNVNTATVADLERLPGVGPVLARRIIEFREARGLFRRLDDLQEVRGVGPKMFRRLVPLLRLD